MQSCIQFSFVSREPAKAPHLTVTAKSDGTGNGERDTPRRPESDGAWSCRKHDRAFTIERTELFYNLSYDVSLRQVENDKTARREQVVIHNPPCSAHKLRSASLSEAGRASTQSP